MKGKETMTYTTPANPQKTMFGSRIMTMLFVLGVIAIQAGSAQAQWTTNGNNINNTNTGNVGIGTTSPSGKLDVQRNDGSDLLVRAWNAATSSGAAIFRAAASSNGSETSRIEFTDAIGFNGSMSGDHTNGLIFRTGNQSGSYSAMGARMTITTGGNVGIGITSPVYSLDVSGGTNGFRAKAASASGSDTIATFENSAGIQAIVRANGNVGLGTTSPAHKFDVQGNTQWIARFKKTDATNGGIIVDAAAGYNPNLAMSVNGTIKWYMNSNTANSDSLQFWESTGSYPRFTLTQAGNVGIGLTNPSEKLEVTGNLKVSGAITGGTISAKYQDVAEWVESSQALGAGTVVVLDHTRSNQVVASSRAYDTRVAGVISLQPGITLGESGATKVLVATTGRVKIKVDASAGAIQIGDLLVTSDSEGVAKKSEPLMLGGVQIHRPGTLIGKALEPLAKGTGEILVLLSLQ